MSLNFTAAVTVSSDFGAQENKICSCSIFSPSICHKVMGPDAMILVFWMLSFKPAFSLSSVTLIKRLFSSSSLYTIRVVSSAYLRLLIFLLAILISAFDFTSLALCKMYSAQKLNKQGDNIQPWHTPFPHFFASQYEKFVIFPEYFKSLTLPSGDQGNFMCSHPLS